MIPILTVIGTQLGIALGGAVMTETVFAWPGIGRLIVDSIANRDAQMVTGAIIMTTMLSSCAILFIDIAYAFVDPRLKRGTSSEVAEMKTIMSAAPETISKKYKKRGQFAEIVAQFPQKSGRGDRPVRTGRDRLAGADFFAVHRL
jgi:hypothetical protein